MPVDEQAESKTRSVVLDPSLAAAVASVANERGISEAAVIRDFLRRGQADYEREREVIERALRGWR